MKSVRQVAIADHLWEALGRMADEMGVDREGLLNQAIHVFARLNGYVVTGAAFEPRTEPPGTVRPPRPAIPPPSRGSSERLAVAERVLQTAARLERAIHERTPGAGPAPLGEGAGPALSLRRDDGSEWEVARDRFLIGRGRHCDLVIDSAKVSREHAAIVRDGDAWFIEDLGSANGTWHDQERIQRRRIEDGDEYFVCAERLRCALK